MSKTVPPMGQRRPARGAKAPPPPPARIDLNELLVFTRVVESGSFTAAARLLEMPKSTVSRKVTELEERVGTRLLQRTTRKLGLTDAGRTYFDHTARIVAEAEEAERALGKLQEAPRGLLRATAPVSFAMLGPIVAEYARRHPDVRVELLCTDRRVDLVEEGYDVALRFGRLQDSTLVLRPLGVIHRVLVASPGYLRRHGTPRAPEELARHAGIVFTGSATPTVWTLHSGDRTVEVRVAPRLMVNDLGALGDAVRAGLGVAWVPDFHVEEDLREGRLKVVLPEWRSDDVPLQVVYPTARHLSPKVAAFVELLAERLVMPGGRRRQA